MVCSRVCARSFCECHSISPSSSFPLPPSSTHRPQNFPGMSSPCKLGFVLPGGVACCLSAMLHVSRFLELPLSLPPPSPVPCSLIDPGSPS